MKNANSSIVTAVLVFALPMLVAIAPTKAATPFIVKVPVDFTGTLDCGFTVIDHNEGSITVHGFSDQNGDPKIEIATFALKESWTNPANGTSVSTTDAGPAITTFYKDGSQTLALIGLTTRVVLKGQGQIAADVGKLVLTFDADGNLTGTAFEAGQHDDVMAAICAALQ